MASTTRTAASPSTAPTPSNSSAASASTTSSPSRTCASNSSTPGFTTATISPASTFPALTKSGKHGLTDRVPTHRRPVANARHVYFSGMTNAGFTLGTPLGPDSWSLYANAAHRFAASAPGSPRGSNSFAVRATRTSSSTTAPSIALPRPRRDPPPSRRRRPGVRSAATSASTLRASLRACVRVRVHPRSEARQRRHRGRSYLDTHESNDSGKLSLVRPVASVSC